MHYVYMLQSEKTSRIYVGCTSNLRRRLQEHNDGKAIATRNKGPWILTYYEAYQDKRDAQERERKLKKHGSTIGHLKKRLKYSLGGRMGGKRRTAA